MLNCSVCVPDDSVPVLRIIRHNEEKQTYTETSSHPSLAACAQDVTTVQQLKKQTCYLLHSGSDGLKPPKIYIYILIALTH